MQATTGMQTKLKIKNNLEEDRLRISSTPQTKSLLLQTQYGFKVYLQSTWNDKPSLTTQQTTALGMCEHVKIGM